MDDAHAAAQPQHLPSVDRLLRQPLAQSLIAEHGHTLVASQARNLLDALRSQVLAGARSGRSKAVARCAGELTQ